MPWHTLQRRCGDEGGGGRRVSQREPFTTARACRRARRQLSEYGCGRRTGVPLQSDGRSAQWVAVYPREFAMSDGVLARRRDDRVHLARCPVRLRTGGVRRHPCRAAAVPLASGRVRPRDRRWRVDDASGQSHEDGARRPSTVNRAPGRLHSIVRRRARRASDIANAWVHWPPTAPICPLRL